MFEAGFGKTLNWFSISAPFLIEIKVLSLQAFVAQISAEGAVVQKTKLHPFSASNME